MSVKLPIFQSTPTSEQLRALNDYADGDSSGTANVTFAVLASNGNVYLARITDYGEWRNNLGGFDTSYTYQQFFILFEKDNLDKITWSETDLHGLQTFDPWYKSHDGIPSRRYVTYNGLTYIIMAYRYGNNTSASLIKTSGCWANCPAYSSAAEFFAAEQPAPHSAPITYASENCTVSGPESGNVGSTVAVSITFPEGYHIRNPASDITVTAGAESVAFTYDEANGQITFTMPGAVTRVYVTGKLITYPITYRPTNVTLSGPTTATVGQTVTVDCTFPPGYGIKSGGQGIMVTNNGKPVEFTYDAESGRITFTMPDPSKRD